MAKKIERDDDRLDLEAVAAMLNVTYASARTMRSRGVFPDAGGKIGNSPWWFRFKVEQWMKERSERTA